MKRDAEVSGLKRLLQEDRRRRAEARQAEGRAEIDALLLPLILTVGRLAARLDHREGLLPAGEGVEGVVMECGS